MQDSRISRFLRLLIHRAERLVRADLRYIIRGGTWLTIAQLFSASSSFLLALAFANFLPAETYGSYKFVTSVMSMLAITTLPGMTTALLRWVAQGRGCDTKAIIWARIRWGLIGGAVAMGFAAWSYLHDGSLALAASFFVIALFLPFSEAYGLFDSILVGSRDFKASAVYSTLLQLGTAAAVGGAVILRSPLPIITLCAVVVPLLLRLNFFHRVKSRIPSGDEGTQEVIAYGKHLTAISILSTVTAYLDRVLVFYFLGSVPLAVYSVAIAPVEQIKGLISNLETLLMPKIAAGNERDFRAVLWKRYLALFVFSAAIIGGYVICAPLFFHFAFPKYPQAVFYSQIFVVSLANLTFFPAGTYLRAKGKVKEQYMSSVFSSVFQIVIMVVCVVQWGIMGLLIARILSRWSATLFNVYLFHRVSPGAE